MELAPTGSVNRVGVPGRIFAAGGGRSRKAPGKVTCSPPPHVAPGSRIASSCSLSCPTGNQLASIEIVPGHGAVAPAAGRAVKMAVTTPPCENQKAAISFNKPECACPTFAEHFRTCIDRRDARLTHTVCSATTSAPKLVSFAPDRSRGGTGTASRSAMATRTNGAIVPTKS